MIDGHGLGALRVPCHGIERNQLAAGGAHIEPGEFGWIELVLRCNFQDDLILAGGSVNGRNLPGAERALQGIFDLPEGQTERGDLVAVDIQHDDRAIIFEVTGRVHKPRKLPDPVEQGGGPAVQFFQIGALQRVLILRCGDLPADADGRGVLHVDADARHSGEFGT